VTGDPTTIWIQAETHKRLKTLKPKGMTFDEPVNAALKESDIEDTDQLQPER